jgi:hypothetical protein
MNSRDRRTGWRPLCRVLATSLVGISVIACTAIPATPSSAPPSPGSTNAPAATQTATAIASGGPKKGDPTPSVTPAGSLSALPNLAPAPPGKWAGLRWIALQEAPIVVALATPAGAENVINGGAKLFGWSRGYVAFETTTWSVSIAGWSSAIDSASSTDGVRWQAGPSLHFADFDIKISRVIEGPAGLLAIGRHAPGACGGGPSVATIWRSTDGVSWQQLSMAGFGSGYVETIDGGSAGYIATGLTSDDKPAVWTSSDGSSWKPASLTAAAFKGMTVIENGTAFSGGYVLAGATLSPDGGCGGPPHLTPSLWWSADGMAWSRDTVPGALSAVDVQMRVCRIDDDSLLANESTYDTTTGKTTSAGWTSTDGRTWQKTSSTTLDCDSIVGEAERGLVFDPPYQQPDSLVAPMRAYEIGAGLTSTALTQTGEMPDQLGWANGELGVSSVAIGPTGVVVAASGGTRIWIGVPVAA